MFQTDWFSVCVTHQPFEYNDPKEITQRGGTSIIMKFNESNKGKNTKQNTQKKHQEHAWTRTHDLLVVNAVP